MRAWMETASAAAGTLALVWLGTAAVAVLVNPLVFPVVVTGGLAWVAWHRWA
jgi:hypothetical protein